MRLLKQPLPSDIDFTIILRRNNQKKLIDYKSNPDNVNNEYAIFLMYFELYVTRMIFNPSLNNAIESRLVSNQLKYTYNRLQITSELLPANSLSYESNTLFGNIGSNYYF